MQEWIHCAATTFEDERDGQGGFATPAERIETLDPT
jgi:hypothetical protein